MKIWAKHIAKLISLLAAIMLLAGPRYAHAQNTAGGPYLNSWHQYSVIPMGDSDNTYEWIIYNDEDDADNGVAADNTNSFELLNSLGWVRNRQVSDENAYIEILFDPSVFSNGDTWYLTYAEYSDGLCIARRKFDLTITENSFYVELPGNDSDCNSMAGSVWDNSHGNLSTRNEITFVPFIVSMNKSDDFVINTWSFTGSLDITSGAARNSINTTPFTNTSGQTNRGYDWELVGTPASFTLTVTVSESDINNRTEYEDDFVEIEVQIIGDITADYALRMSIDPDEVQATSGSAYIVETGDNGTGNKTQIRTLFGIPNTSIVSVSSP